MENCSFIKRFKAVVTCTVALMAALLFVTVQSAQAYTLGNNESEYTNDGTINESGANGIHIGSSGSVSDTTVINNGTITVDTAYNHGIESYRDNTTITNNGTIVTTGTPVGIGMVASGGADKNVLVNNGLILTADTGMMLNGGGNADASGVLINNGTIIATSDEWAEGLWQAMNDGTAINNGTISATGGNYCFGIDIWNSEFDIDNSNTTNNGIIEVSGGVIDNIGIWVESAAGTTHTFTNYGSITASGNNAYAILGGDGNETVMAFTGSTMSGAIQLGKGSDILLFAGGDFSGVTIFDGGDDIDTADGWIDTLTFNGSSGTITGGNVLNWENVVIGAASSIFFADNMLTVGSEAGLGLMNFGTITTQDGAADDTLTIDGNYIGGGGTLAIDTVLGDSASATDKLEFNGDTSGTSILSINNLGGYGAKTTGNGIEVAKVSGSSNGTFTLSDEIVAGAYLYELFQADGQNWYLQSNLLPQIDDYAALSMALAQPLTLATLHQRVGHRRGRLEVGGSQGHKGVDTWFRTVGGMRDGAPDNEVSFKQEYYYMQGGMDKQIFVNSKGRLTIGANGHYGQSDTDISHGVNGSDADGDFYGLGFTLTWYGNPDYYGDGYYVDLVTQYSINELDFSSDRTRHSIDGDNWSFSVEAGKRLHPFKSMPNVSLVPQAQIILVESDFDSFTDDDGVRVSSDDGRLLKSRVGLKLERHPVSEESNQSVGYVIANLHHNIDNETSIDASGVDMDYEDRSAWFGIGSGGTIKVKSNIEIYGELYASTSIDGFGDAFSTSGNVGVSMSW